MNKGTLLVLGARSDIARAVATRFARQGFAIQLAARNAAKLADDKADLELRFGVRVELHELDALDLESHRGFVDALAPLPDCAICAIGVLGKQEESEKATKAATLVMRSNFEGPASVLAHLANRFEERGSGALVGISSVAGERGRATNYIYGSAKAGFTAFLSGLRNRLCGKGVHVMTVLPGFVATRMTEGLALPANLTAKPEEVAEAIWIGAQRKKNVIYTRPIWRLVMAIIRTLPEVLFKRLQF